MEERCVSSDGSVHWAFRILHFGFTVLPIVAGLDKFFNYLTNWEMYLAPALGRILPLSAGVQMRAIGVVEIIAGVIVAVKPRLGAFIVAVWLLAIVVNLLIAQGYYDVALRDIGLCMGGIALGLLSKNFQTACCFAK